MAVAMLPEPMMLMVVMTCSLRIRGSVGWGVFCVVNVLTKLSRDS